MTKPLDISTLATERGEDFLRKVLDVSLNGLYVYDFSRGSNTFINARYTALTGYTLPELDAMEGDAFAELFHPQDRTRVSAHMAALCATDDDRRLEVEYRFRRKDGNWIWCISSDSVFERDADGVVRSIIGTFIDISARKQAEAQRNVSESDARGHLDEIQRIYNSIPIGLCVLDRELRYVRINERLAEINGVSANEHLGRTVNEVVPGLARQAQPRLRQVIETGEPVLDIEIRGETPAEPGVKRTWLESWLPLRGVDGTISGVSIIAREVTRERQILRRLEASEARFQSMFDCAAVGIAQTALDGRFMRVNQRMCEITGYARDDLTRLHFQDITHPDDLQPDLDQSSRLLCGEIADFSIEKRYIRKDGDAVWIKLTSSLVRRQDGTPDYFISVIDDVSKRRAAEDRERTLAKVIETSNDFIGVAELDGRGVYLNRAGQRLVGLDGDAMVRATRIDDYLFPEDLPFVRDTVMPTVLRKGRWAGEFRFRHFISGEPVTVYWDVVRIDDPDSGQPVRFGTVTRDTRAQKANETSLREANRRKDEFLAVMGHELRNPMAPICNSVEIIKLLMSDDDPRVEQALEILERQTRHMSRLLDDLLDISRIVAGKLRLECRAVEIREVIEKAVEDVSLLMEEHRHQVEVELPPEGTLVNGDPLRLTQILMNLLVNAANHTRESATIQVTTVADDTEVMVTIRDNGPGLTDEQIDELFLPFVQGERDLTTRGLGLGLTIARRMAELHGGHLDAESHSPQPGTAFQLHLPRLQTAQKPTPEEQVKPVAQAGIQILLVEDNPDVARSLLLLLQILGCEVESATTGGQALAAAMRKCPRLALIDLGLPDMDGLQLARSLRERYPDNSQLMLVALTGYGHDEARARSQAAGFDDHLAKPIDRRTLEKVFARLR